VSLEIHLATEVKPYVVIKIALADVSAFGEPDAGKLASPVRRGTVGNVLTQVSNAQAVYPTQVVAGSSPAWCAIPVCIVF
jgi:hypothetical protein